MLNSKHVMIKKSKNQGDKLLIALLLGVCIFGLVMLYSASSYIAKVDYNDSFYFVKKQLLGILLGIVAMIFSATFNYKKIIKYRYLAMALSVLILLLPFTPLGKSSYGATRWISIGSFTIQPSEFAKFLYIIFVASYLALNPSRAKSLKGILPILMLGGTICLLIMLEPNMSITVCMGMLMLEMLFISGVKFKTLAVIILPLAILAPILVIVEPYRLDRLSAFIDPWSSAKDEGYQLIQSLYAIGSGGFFGVGLFNSRQKFKFLPFSESDFILSVIVEELGFFGVTILFLIFFIIVYRSIKIAISCKSYFGFLLVSGIISIFVIQIILNALVVSGSMPPTGLPLPLISSGNTSIIAFLFAFGIVYNISKDKS